MTVASGVTLSMLDSRFHVVSDDARMIELVEQLWEPFVASPDPGAHAHEVVLESISEGWRLRVPGEPANSAVDPWVFVSSLRNALSRRSIADATSVVPVHAAALERDGVFVVFSGPPRAGKTTLLLELLGRGWLLVTDDLVPVDPDSLTATPFPKPLSVRDPERWRHHARGWEVPGWLPRPAVVGLLPATAFPRTAATSFEPSLLVFSRYAPAETPALERLTTAATVAWCADNLHSRPGDPGVLGVIARLGGATPGYVVRYRSSGEAVNLLENSLAALRSME